MFNLITKLSAETSPTKSHGLSFRNLLAATTAVLCFSASGTAGATIYTYQGNAFTTQNVTGLHRVTATVDLDTSDPLHPNSWSIVGLDNKYIFSDEELGSSRFDVTLDAHENIVAWNIDVLLDVGNEFVVAIQSSNLNGDNAFSSVADNQPCDVDSCHFVDHNGRVSSTGAWSPTFTAGVPEPATWAMMLVGFGGIGSIARRRRSFAFSAA